MGYLVEHLPNWDNLSVFLCSDAVGSVVLPHGTAHPLSTAGAETALRPEWGKFVKYM
jgi:hypothetical protein